MGAELKAMRSRVGTVVINKQVDELTTPTRREAMLKMWAMGYTFAELAEHWEYDSPAFCRAVIERALADADVALDKDQERTKFEMSLLQDLRIASVHAHDNDDREQMPWMRMRSIIIDRLIKLKGLDAPTQIVVTPGVNEFETFTTKLALANGATEIHEADPMGGAA